MTTGTERTRRLPMTSDVTEPLLFMRLFEMLNDVGCELGREELDAGARLRAALLLKQARCRFREALSPAVVAEFESIEPELTDEPTVAELRLAYRGTVAWLAGLSWPPTSQALGSTPGGSALGQ